MLTDIRVKKIHVVSRYEAAKKQPKKQNKKNQIVEKDIRLMKMQECHL